MAFIAPLATNSGWIASSDEDYPNESGLSKENRYLWQLKKTTYTKDPSIDYEVSLFAQYESGVCANLLEDTAFNDINDMDAWNIKDGKVVEQAYESQNGFEVTTDDEKEYRDVLRQTVYLSKELKKLEANTWYTLSFYGMMDGYHIIYHGAAKSNNVSPYYMVQYEKDHIYVDPGQTISVYVIGWVASTSVYMRYYCWRANNDGSWAQSAHVTFSTTTTASQRITFTNNSSNTAKIYMRGYVYNSDGTQNSSSETSHRGYIQSVYVTRGSALDTYIYRSDFGKAVIADTSAPWICDGNVVNTAKYLSDSDTTKQYLGTYAYFTTNGHIRWQMTDAVLRHSFTFKTPSTLAEDVSYYVLFRASTYAHPGWISKPKLERNTMATEWIEHTNDRMAADFQHIYAGVWSASTAYMYANGVRHVVRAKKSANGEMTYFRLKKRTSSSGYKNSSEPYSDTRYWEEASFLKFVATDLMLADEVITDKLTVSKIRGAGGKFILDKDGNVTGINCKFINSSVSGYFHKEKVTITSANWNQYMTTSSDGYSMFDLEKTGSWIEITYAPSATNHIFFKYAAKNSGLEDWHDGARSLVGQNVLLYNKSGKTFQITTNFRNSSGGTVPQVTLSSGYFISMDCKSGIDSNGYEEVYWTFVIGRYST